MPPAYADDVDGGAAARRRLPDFSRRRLTIDDASYHVPAAAGSRPGSKSSNGSKAAPSRSTLHAPSRASRINNLQMQADHYSSVNGQSSE